MAVVISAVILESPKIKSATVSTVSPSICHEVMGPDAIVYRIVAIIWGGGHFRSCGRLHLPKMVTIISLIQCAVLEPGHQYPNSILSQRLSSLSLTVGGLWANRMQ